jgi:hypothetical protein
MSLLDDARRLLEDRPARGGSVLKSHPQGRCYYCAGDGYGEPHAPDCPWLALPQIVAALEGRERALAALAAWNVWDDSDAALKTELMAALEVVPTDAHLTGTTA